VNHRTEWMKLSNFRTVRVIWRRKSNNKWRNWPENCFGCNTVIRNLSVNLCSQYLQMQVTPFSGHIILRFYSNLCIRIYDWNKLKKTLGTAPGYIVAGDFVEGYFVTGYFVALISSWAYFVAGLFRRWVISSRGHFVARSFCRVP
jgi:hypothetical protein